jgi:hypothetical protein
VASDPPRIAGITRSEHFPARPVRRALTPRVVSVAPCVLPPGDRRKADSEQFSRPKDLMRARRRSPSPSGAQNGRDMIPHSSRLGSLPPSDQEVATCYRRAPWAREQGNRGNQLGPRPIRPSPGNGGGICSPASGGDRVDWRRACHAVRNTLLKSENFSPIRPPPQTPYDPGLDGPSSTQIDDRWCLDGPC